MYHNVLKFHFHSIDTTCRALKSSLRKQLPNPTKIFHRGEGDEYKLIGFALSCAPGERLDGAGGALIYCGGTQWRTAANGQKLTARTMPECVPDPEGKQGYAFLSIQCYISVNISRFDVQVFKTHKMMSQYVSDPEVGRVAIRYFTDLEQFSRNKCIANQKLTMPRCVYDPKLSYTILQIVIPFSVNFLPNRCYSI